MRVGIVGGGPAGQYFALLMEKHHPAHQIRIVEQNPAGVTYDWGVKVLLAVSRLLLAHPEVAELDINPLRATSAGLYALDALIILES